MSTSGPVDIWRRFRALPTQERFLLSGSKYRLYSSGYGGGKSASGCRESIKHAIKYPGSRNMISRLHYPDLRDTTHQTLKREMGYIGLNDGSRPGPRHYRFVKSENTYEWWNGSVTLLRNLDEDEKFGSLELSTVFIDEGSEVPDGVYQVLFPGRLRWHLPSCDYQDRILAAGMDQAAEVAPCGCPRRGWVCTNPGASGYLRQVVNGGIPDWEFFHVPPGENVYNGPEYLAEMESKGRQYGPVWYARFVAGSWDAFEGQRFTMFSRSDHVLPTDMEPDPERHFVYEGWDFGFRNPTAVVWVAFDKSGEYPPVVVDEYEVAETEIPDHAEAIKAKRARLRLTGRDHLVVGDPAGAAVGRTGMSDIMLYATNGIFISPCYAGKTPGPRADLIALMLSDRWTTASGQMPGLMVNPRCERTIQCIIDYRFREQKSKLGEAPKEAFLKKDDHLIDALGYALISSPEATAMLHKQRPERKVAPTAAVSAKEAWRLLLGDKG